MEILQHKQQFGIFGMRILARDRTVIVQNIWFDQPSQVDASWERLEVPQGKEIIGVHGFYDGSYVRGLGLQVWTPKP